MEIHLFAHLLLIVSEVPLLNPVIVPNGHLLAPRMMANTWTARKASNSNRSLSPLSSPFSLIRLIWWSQEMRSRVAATRGVATADLALPFNCWTLEDVF